MTNLPSCSYCDNPAYNNNIILWTEQKEVCERVAAILDDYTNVAVLFKENFCPGFKLTLP